MRWKGASWSWHIERRHAYIRPLRQQVYRRLWYLRSFDVAHRAGKMAQGWRFVLLRQ